MIGYDLFRNPEDRFYRATAHMVYNIMGHNVRKPAFRASDKVRFKPTFSTTETSHKIEILFEACLDNMILSNTQIIKTLIRLCRCTGWSTPLLFANLRFSCVEAHIIYTQLYLPFYAFHACYTYSNALPITFNKNATKIYPEMIKQMTIAVKGWKRVLG